MENTKQGTESVKSGLLIWKENNEVFTLKVLLWELTVLAHAHLLAQHHTEVSTLASDSCY